LKLLGNNFPNSNKTSIQPQYSKPQKKTKVGKGQRQFCSESHPPNGTVTISTNIQYQYPISINIFNHPLILCVKKFPFNHHIPNHKREQKKTKVGKGKRVTISTNIQYQSISFNLPPFDSLKKVSESKSLKS
jgi:hypothetical protein